MKIDRCRGETPNGRCTGDDNHRGSCWAPGRYPCSATCTHDDASTPGHPERVKERSEAFAVATELVDPCACRKGSPCPKHATDAEWMDMTDNERTVWNDGAEAMRAACLRDVVALLESTGLRDHGSDSIIQRVKAAIMGATP